MTEQRTKNEERRTGGFAGPDSIRFLKRRAVRGRVERVRRARRLRGSLLAGADIAAPEDDEGYGDEGDGVEGEHEPGLWGREAARLAAATEAGEHLRQLVL